MTPPSLFTAHVLSPDRLLPTPISLLSINTFVIFSKYYTLWTPRIELQRYLTSILLHTSTYLCSWSILTLNCLDMWFYGPSFSDIFHESVTITFFGIWPLQWLQVTTLSPLCNALKSLILPGFGQCLCYLTLCFDFVPIIPHINLLVTIDVLHWI